MNETNYSLYTPIGNPTSRDKAERWAIRSNKYFHISHRVSIQNVRDENKVSAIITLLMANKHGSWKLTTVLSTNPVFARLNLQSIFYQPLLLPLHSSLAPWLVETGGSTPDSQELSKMPYHLSNLSNFSGRCWPLTLPHPFLLSFQLPS